MPAADALSAASARTLQDLSPHPGVLRTSAGIPDAGRKNLLTPMPLFAIIYEQLRDMRP